MALPSERGSGPRGGVPMNLPEVPDLAEVFRRFMARATSHLNIFQGLPLETAGKNTTGGRALRQVRQGGSSH